MKQERPSWKNLIKEAKKEIPYDRSNVLLGIVSSKYCNPSVDEVSESNQNIRNNDD